jgi:class 3 adenylate cyclase
MRKVVTALFCDLVQFTASSETADPEDIDRMLTAFGRMARAQIELHGGAVEKFIGDAVVGVFGVPTAHVDDPARAVRAGLRIVEESGQLWGIGGAPVRLRIGINTGEALVRGGVGPGSGERFLAGDAINTASRLQAAAPVMGVAVGLATYEATRAAFEYAELPRATLKGKAEPVRVFHAVAALGRSGSDLIRTHDTPYVGRQIDRSLLQGLFDKTVTSSSVQLVTVVGEPGIGKSRLVLELLAHAQAMAPDLTWRQGRCLPYGDGVTFWALGEIVKAHAGILESDDPETATAKLDAALPSGPDRDWLAQRLLPLLGVSASSPAERDELFAAWRSFLEGVAEDHPTVLVFEDIHWADEALLAFLEHLADRAEGVPLLVVATARPDLFQRHASFAVGLPNVNRINLAPLSEADTRELVAALLGAAVPADLQDPILQRAEGNPLFAEEFVRLLKDRDLLEETDAGIRLRTGAELPLPESLQALIAARLDTLSAEQKAMLADAAVVGKVFWAGAVAAIGAREPAAVADAFRELSRRDLVRLARHSSMAGDTEFAFWHVLARDVAYGQLPRAARAQRHAAVAAWLEEKAAERLEDIAEVLAHHYATALELQRAIGNEERSAPLEAAALRYLLLAGDRARNLDVESAVATYERALALTPPGRPERAAVQARLGSALNAAGRVTAAVTQLEEAIAADDDRGDTVNAARTRTMLAKVLHEHADDARAEVIADEAVAALDGQAPNEALAEALAVASQGFGALGYRDAGRAAQQERAIAMADALGLEALKNEAIGRRALRRVNTGDVRGVDDLRATLAWGLAAGASEHAGRMYFFLSSCLGVNFDPVEALTLADEGQAFCRSRGLRALDLSIRGERGAALVRLGRWAEVLANSEDVIAEATAAGQLNTVGRVSEARIWVLTETGRMAEATAEMEGLLEGDPDVRTYDYAILRSRLIQQADGPAAAGAFLAQAIHDLKESGLVPSPDYPLELARSAIALGRLDAATEAETCPVTEDAVHMGAVRQSYAALFAEDKGLPEDAAAAYLAAQATWRNLGDPYETARSGLAAARCLVAAGRGREARPVLGEARAIFDRLGAAPASAEATALLDQLAPA